MSEIREFLHQQHQIHLSMLQAGDVSCNVFDLVLYVTRSSASWINWSIVIFVSFSIWSTHRIGYLPWDLCPLTFFEQWIFSRLSTSWWYTMFSKNCRNHLYHMEYRFVWTLSSLRIASLVLFSMYNILIILLHTCVWKAWILPQFSALLDHGVFCFTRPFKHLEGKLETS